MVRLVLFDIDGTLVHSGGAGVKAFGHACHSEFGVAEGAARIKFAGRTDVSLVREFFVGHGFEPSPENFQRFFESYLGWLRRTLPESQGGPCAGVLEFMAALETLPEPPVIGLLTGNIRRGAQLKLEHYGLWHKFPFGGFADDHEDRDQIAVAAHRRGSDHFQRPLNGNEVLVIGDTPFDIRCGRAIQARVLAVATGGATLEQLQAHQPNWAVRDLREITASAACA